MIGIFPPTYTFIEEQASKDELKINLWSSVTDSLNSSSSTISLKIKSSTVSTMTESEEMNISERLKHWAVAFLDPKNRSGKGPLYRSERTAPEVTMSGQTVTVGAINQVARTTMIWEKTPEDGIENYPYIADPPVTETRRHVHPHHCVYIYIYMYIYIH